jgi:transcriptional regulator with XRE-family HTH domain
MHVQAVQNFRANVRSAMASLGWSQDKLATEAELSRPFLNRVLQGRQEPSLEVCDRIADALHSDLSELLGSPRQFLKNLPRAIAG